VKHGEKLRARFLDEVAEDVDRGPIELRADLHAGDDLDAKRLACGDGLGIARDCVVIDDRDGRQTQFRGPLHAGARAQ